MSNQIKCSFCQIEQQSNEAFLRFKPKGIFRPIFFCKTCETNIGGKHAALNLVIEVFVKRTKTLLDYNFFEPLAMTVSNNMKYRFELTSEEKGIKSRTETTDNSLEFITRTLLAASFQLTTYEQEIKLEFIDENRFQVITDGNKYLLQCNKIDEHS